MFEELSKRIDSLEAQIREWYSRRFDQESFIPNGIKQRHIDGLIIHTGLAADRPDGSTHVKAYFNTDDFKLSIWTGTAWKEVTLS